MLQSNLMVLAFAIIAFIKLRQSVEAVMLDVFLPVLLLVPAIYYLRIPHVPLISCSDAVLLPLGAAALLCRSHNLRFQRADLWVVGFAIAGFYTDYLNLGLLTAVYNCVESGFLGGVLAYFIGKLMIEQTGKREQFVSRMAGLLAAIGFISLSEFVAKRDLFVTITHRFFGRVDYWGDQYRFGFERVKGPFLGAEEAGIVFLMGLFLSIWLWFLNRDRKDIREPRYLGMRRSTLLVAGTLLGLAMTLSRGPLLGAVVGYLIARVGLVKKKRLAATLAVLLIAVGCMFAYEKAKAYARLYDETDPVQLAADESKASATYRTRLYKVYQPVAEKGGMFGWSATAYPRDPSFFSIDNEYLLLWVTQGKVGISFFLLVVAEGAIAIIRAIRSSRHANDTSFYCCLGGILTGVVVVLVTVFLAGQGYILFFLCSGWIQSLPHDEWAPRSAPEFEFRRIFT